jgi:CIC family chloride channel protein
VGHELVGAASVVATAAVAAMFAHLFRAAATATLRWMSGARDPIDAAGHLSWPIVWVVVASAAAIAAVVGHRVAARSAGRHGLAELARAGRGESSPPTVRTSLARGSGTWLATATMVPVGRESAILEAGGAMGAALGARTRVGAGPMIAAGLAGAFAAAYHAPLAAVLFVHEHVGLSGRRRVAAYGVLGAATGHAITVASSGGSGEAHLFPAHVGSWSSLLVMGAVALVPATMGSILIGHVRTRIEAVTSSRATVVARIAGLSIVAGGVVALVPMAAGNGTEALARSAAAPTIDLAIALALAKMVATSTSLSTGLPGGAFTPTMATSAGWALMAFWALHAVGVELPGDWWNGVLIAMVVGVAVGVGAPWTAVAVVAEMAGDLAMIPVAAVAVVLALGLRAAWGWADVVGRWQCHLAPDRCAGVRRTAVRPSAG